MKTIINIPTEVDVKTLQVNAGVRYWEDAKVNGVNDTEEGDNIPCKHGSLWSPTIDLETGQILNWEAGKTANIHYKVCDAGSYYLQDADGKQVIGIENEYVPSMLCPKEKGYGDYIIMDVDANGFVQNWKPLLSDFNIED